MSYMFVSVVKYCHVVMICDVCSNQYELSHICVDGITPLMCVVSIQVACVLLVNVFCNFACSEAAVTTTLVNKFLLTRSLHSDAMGELGQFSQQLLHSKLQFTAFGFFSLNFTFIYGFVGGAATYIMILLQFQ
jgi:gustatory receptor